MKTRVLWIEDSASYEYSSWVAPIYYSGQYDLKFAENVTKAVDLIQSDEFDVLIVDLRLPPGNDRYWQKIYEKASSDSRNPHLGFNFLVWLLGQDDKKYDRRAPAWIAPNRICVFTVETRNEVATLIAPLGIKVLEQKTAAHPDTILIQLIQRVLGETPPPTYA